MSSSKINSAQVPQSTPSMFADDLKFYRIIKSHLDIDHLQADIDSLWNWSSKNSMGLNIEKCFQISFYTGERKSYHIYNMNGYNLKEFSEVKDLGVWVDIELSFFKQINTLYPKAMRMLGYLIRNSHSGVPRWGQLPPPPLVG